MGTGQGEAKETQQRTTGSRMLRDRRRLAQMWEEVVGQAAKTPWLVRSLMVQGNEMAARAAAQYLWVRRLPRRVRRLLKRRGALSLAATALVLALTGPAPGWAGTTVSVGSGSALTDAIAAANSQFG